jgi:hypothetical protein
MSWDVLNSIAYKSLTHSAGKALPYFIGKPKAPFNDPAQCNTDIHFPYAEAKRYGFAPGTFSKIIHELVAKGFLDPVDKGGLRCNGKSYNVFRMSRRWEKYGTSEFQPCDWRSFFPGRKLKATSKKETYSFKEGNEKAADSTSFSENDAVGVVLP